MGSELKRANKSWEEFMEEHKVAFVGNNSVIIYLAFMEGFKKGAEIETKPEPKDKWIDITEEITTDWFDGFVRLWVGKEEFDKVVIGRIDQDGIYFYNDNYRAEKYKDWWKIFRKKGND